MHEQFRLFNGMMIVFVMACAGCGRVDEKALTGDNQKQNVCAEEGEEDSSRTVRSVNAVSSSIEDQSSTRDGDKLKTASFDGKKQSSQEEETVAKLVAHMAKVGVKVEVKSEDELLIQEGFPYQKEISGRDTIEIDKVENGIFTASKTSIVPTEMMGMVYGVAGGSFVAKCNAKEGTRTLADCVGNKWIFKNSGMEFSVCPTNSKTVTYTVRSNMPEATISFTKDGVLLKGFIVTPVTKP